MIDVEEIKRFAQEYLADGELFVVDVTCSALNEIEVVIDSDTSVDVDSCAELSRLIDEHLDREKEDYELTVSSAGIGQPLKMYRQYRRLIGSPVEVVMLNGTKIVAELKDATEDSITLSYTEKRAVEGKKRKVDVAVENTYPLGEVKSTKEYLDFK